MQAIYQPRVKMEYSRCAWEPGWNVKLVKAGKTLCTVYPKCGFFRLLIVVGAKEKNTVEYQLPRFCEVVRECYRTTSEGNGQRWLMLDICTEDAVYRDALELIRIRRTSK